METNKQYKIYLSQEDFEALRKKALELNIIGRGWLSNYIRRIAGCDIAFLDSNVKKILSSFKIK